MLLHDNTDTQQFDNDELIQQLVTDKEWTKYIYGFKTMMNIKEKPNGKIASMDILNREIYIGGSSNRRSQSENKKKLRELLNIAENLQKQLDERQK